MYTISDPAVNPDAKKFDEISIDDVVNNRLGVIDLAAAVLCMENRHAYDDFWT